MVPKTDLQIHCIDYITSEIPFRKCYRISNFVIFLPISLMGLPFDLVFNPFFKLFLYNNLANMTSLSHHSSEMLPGETFCELLGYITKIDSSDNLLCTKGPTMGGGGSFLDQINIFMGKMGEINKWPQCLVEIQPGLR